MVINGIPQVSQAAAALGNLALITPLSSFGYSPINALTGQVVGFPLSGIYEGENKIRLESGITDSWLANNQSVQDHIVNKPEVITVRLFVGETTIVAPVSGALGAAGQAVLGAISAFGPVFTPAQQQVQSQTVQAYYEQQLSSNLGVAAWNSLTGSGAAITAAGVIPSLSQNKQQAFFAQLYGYWRAQVNQVNPILWQVQTPWAVLTPCGLLSAESTQSEETETVSEFFLTFKMIRTVSDLFNASTQFAGRSANLAQSTANNGTTTLGPKMPLPPVQVAGVGL